MKEARYVVIVGDKECAHTLEYFLHINTPNLSFTVFSSLTPCPPASTDGCVRDRQGIELEKEYKVADKVKDSLKKSIDSAKN